MLKLLHLALALIATFGIVSETTICPAQAIDSDTANRSMNSSQVIVAFLIVGGGATVIAYSAKRGNYLPKISNGSTSLQQTEQTNPHLQRKLLRLLHDDRNTANRLISYTQKTHPNRSSNWVLEKVIYDLERDRNRR
ncbi:MULTISPECIES: hypothetical protein [unclassified Leptolyngbya]|uniref:hypothetical protein n=1 Tax=unclassified Leptolyngbya TaxID=2650499 RepID=UPI001687C1EA|nr:MULTISPECIES: hypothetical protein [unclassified Leptolyngbya]MBD1913772.1 hypothetical protein [Leptolyngbya sp. FACHB-8]MBD2152997.1 hypothetical protein [Leptolyngbya sp. FACHB-16]